MEFHLAPHVWSVTSINESLQHPGESLPGLSGRWGDRLSERKIYFPYRKHRKKLSLEMIRFPTELDLGHQSWFDT